ncbi:MAG: hypothetical protein GW903_01670 [Alphaproteobacteria bacterium]|nr:hypothetical protein [Alphaproteobacteria bacterium]NCQ87678.1 hypothetical protein [Alphaproteobacteria bacterium]NCT05813.1 hypothetical protein [Alphaproteobacteria bacterium]
MLKKLPLLTALFLVSLPLNAMAATIGCPALEDPKNYKGNSDFKKIIMGQEDWVFRTKIDFSDDFDLNSAGRERFKRFNDALAKHDIELVLALVPTRGMMHHDKINYPEFDFEKAKASYLELAQQIEDQGIDVATAFDVPRDGDGYFYKRDHHWKSEGAKHMAKAVAQKIRAMPFYDGLAKTSFKTEPNGEHKQKGTFEEFIEKQCGQDIPDETVTQYKTYAESSDDLFGDTKPAEIILIGTSNSVQVTANANFDGYLREFIGADVENRAISGGGIDSSLFKWLMAPEFKANKPKVLIWEIPVYQDLDSGSFYRQAIPTAYGSCKGNDVLSDTITAGKQNDLFKAAFSNDVSGVNHYVELFFNDWTERKLRFNVEYKDGQKDSLSIRRVKKYAPDGKFFIELDQGITAPIKNISLLLPEEYKGKIEARLCAFNQ